MRNIVTGLFILALLNGCSAKEFNAGADSITSDITNAFENSKDTTSK